jgi:hypothetical protein
MRREEGVRRWHELTAQMREREREIARLADERQHLTQQMYASGPDVTTRSLGERLGISGVMVGKILHRGEPKPGSRVA